MQNTGMAPNPKGTSTFCILNFEFCIRARSARPIVTQRHAK